MHHGHTYAAQSAALYIALIPFVLLFTMIVGARFFERIRRSRKPAAQRPAIIGVANIAPVRRALSAVD